MNPRQTELMRYFTNGGYSIFGSAAMVGNFCVESGPDLPTKFTLVTDHGSQGLAQWRLERLAALEKFAEDGKLAVTDLLTQAAFVVWELERDYVPLSTMLKSPGARSVANLTANFSSWFERPAKQYENLDRRIKYAEACAKEFVPVATGAPKTETALGTAIIGSAVTVGAVAWTNGVGMALITTSALGIVLVIAAMILGHLTKPKAVQPVELTTLDPLDELRQALGELKVARGNAEAAAAVVQSKSQAAEKLLLELKGVT